MNVLDVVLVLTVATVVGLAWQRRLVGLMVGVGGALALRPLLLLADANPWLGVAGGLLVGLALALIGRLLLPGTSSQSAWTYPAGGLGGAVLGVALLLTLVTSLPIQREALNPNQLRYPPQDIPVAVRSLVDRSLLMQLGREVLFAPLLAQQEARSPQRNAVMGTLHGWVVVGEPWRRP